jgi:hypothetical protein
MKLPVLKNSVAMPASISDDQSVEDFIRKSTQNLQRASANVPGKNRSNLSYLTFDGQTGEWKLNKEVVDPKSLGKILAPYQGLFEGCIEWANGMPLQKKMRQLLGVEYEEAMSDRLLDKPLSPNAYRKSDDGPTYVMGFLGCILDDGTHVSFEHKSGGGLAAVSGLATAAIQAVAAFGEIVHPAIELGSSSYENRNNKTIYNPALTVIGYVTDKRVHEVAALSDSDIITRPMPSRARLRRETNEDPAI